MTGCPCNKMAFDSRGECKKHIRMSKSNASGYKTGGNRAQIQGGVRAYQCAWGFWHMTKGAKPGKRKGGTVKPKPR